MIYLKAVFLAIVEGLTEFLPVSSTGHMLVVDSVAPLSSDEAFNKAFIIIIQLPAVLSVVLYFWKTLWPFGKAQEECRRTLSLWTKIVVAFIPAAVIGLLLDDWLEARLFNAVTVAIALIVGGVILLILERGNRSARIETSDALSYGRALGIGFIQCIAMIPGTSRSAATIIGAMALGSSRALAAEFSFFLAIPTMFGATAVKLHKVGFSFTGEQWAVLALGSLTSFAVAYAVVAFLMNYVRRHDFRPFGYYRIVAGAAVLILWALGIVSATAL